MTVDLSIDKKSGCRSRYRMIVGFSVFVSTLIKTVPVKKIRYHQPSSQDLSISTRGINISPGSLCQYPRLSSRPVIRTSVLESKSAISRVFRISVLLPYVVVQPAQQSGHRCQSPMIPPEQSYEPLCLHDSQQNYSSRLQTL